MNIGVHIFVIESKRTYNIYIILYQPELNVLTNKLTSLLEQKTGTNFLLTTSILVLCRDHQFRFLSGWKLTDYRNSADAEDSIC